MRTGGIISGGEEVSVPLSAASRQTWCQWPYHQTKQATWNPINHRCSLIQTAPQRVNFRKSFENPLWCHPYTSWQIPGDDDAATNQQHLLHHYQVVEYYRPVPASLSSRPLHQLLHLFLHHQAVTPASSVVEVPVV